MTQKDPKKPEAPVEKQAEKPANPPTLSDKAGFAKLDLSIEEVEERVNPRETNVFDK